MHQTSANMTSCGSHWSPGKALSRSSSAGNVICPGSHSWSSAEPGLKPRSLLNSRQRSIDPQVGNGHLGDTRGRTEVVRRGGRGLDPGRGNPAQARHCSVTASSAPASSPAALTSGSPPLTRTLTHAQRTHSYADTHAGNM